MSPPEPSTQYCFPVCIDSLLGTNEIPSPTERRSILDGLIGPEKRLQELRTEIQRMEEQLAYLMLNEEDLALKVAPYQDLLSPFRKLPDDILREIFIACLPDDYAPVIDIHQPPLLLTRISSRLRRLALSTHRLWTTISIPIVLPCFTEWCDGRDESRASIAERTMLKYTLAVDEWLGRTGGCDIEVFVHEFGNDSADRYIEGIFGILIGLASRWKSISLHCSAYSIQKFCVMLGRRPSSQIDFPRLERLSLDISGLYLEQEDPQEQYNYTSQLPYAFLRSVRLVMPLDDYMQYHFQWSRLAYLSLGSIKYPSSLNSIVKILETCPNLLACKLYIKMDKTQLRLCLPHLKRISLVFDQEAWFDNHAISYYTQSEDAYDFCNHLDTPALERITYDASVDFLPLLGLVNRMGDHLTHLSVTHFEVPTELIECLKACPRLTALNVSRPDGIPRASRRHYQWFRPAPWASSLVLWATAGDKLLRYLMAAGDVDEMVQSQLCPHLEHFVYHISDGPMSCEALETFILDKCSTPAGVGSRLKELSVSVHGGQQNLQRLRYSVNAQLLAGLHLRLSPSRTTRYRLMEHSMPPLMRQLKWWDDESNTDSESSL